MNTTYITTTIPYVNAKPHIGFALELVQADTLARYARCRGERVRLQTGTDENAWKNVESARAQGCSPREFVAHNTEAFRRLGQALNISVDEFVHTGEARHRQAVWAWWQRLRAEDLYRQAYTGHTAAVVRILSLSVTSSTAAVPTIIPLLLPCRKRTISFVSPPIKRKSRS